MEFFFLEVLVGFVKWGLKVTYKQIMYFLVQILIIYCNF